MSGVSSTPSHPAAARRDDRWNFVVEQAADAAADHAEQAAGEEDPGLGARVAVRVDPAGSWPRRITSAT